MSAIQPADKPLRLPLIPLPVLVAGICTSFAVMMTFVILAWVSGLQEGGSIWPWAGYALSVSALEVMSFSLIALRVHRHKRAWAKQERRIINERFKHVRAKHAAVQTVGR